MSLVAGCDTSEPTVSDWWNARDSAGFHTLAESSSTCRDCITFERIALLGDTAGPGYVEWTEHVAQDSAGNFWVGQRDAIKVFDSSGMFLRQVGRSGQGPLEFQSGRPIHTDKDGNVHIFDIGNMRETIVGADFGFLADRRIPGIALHAVFFPGVDMYVVNMLIQTAELIGLPIHIVEESEILHSFGAPVGGRMRPLNTFNSQRRLAIDQEGHVFSAEYYNYVIEAWTPKGQRITGFLGPDLNKIFPIPGPIADDNPLVSQIWGINADESQRLWVVSAHPPADWRDKFEERVLPNGRLVLQQMDESPRSIATGRIDVIDLRSGSIIASSNCEEVITAIVGDGLFLEVQYAESGVPRLAIWRITLAQP